MWQMNLLDKLKQWRTLSDFIIILAAVFVYYGLRFYSIPSIRGFYCDDESIRYPVGGETISETVIYCIGFCIGLLLILITEYALGRKNLQKAYLSGYLLPAWTSYAYTLCVEYIVGLLILLIGVLMAKTVTGSLRPYFIEVCQPNIDISNCAKYNNAYITNYKCQEGYSLDSRKSFPSGHAAVASYLAVYCVQYIQVKWVVSRINPLRVWKYVVQAVITIGCFIIIQTRYVDNFHHPIDLIVGSIMGITFALVQVSFVSQLYCSSIPNKNSMESRPLVTSNPSSTSTHALLQDSSNHSYSTATANSAHQSLYQTC